MNILTFDIEDWFHILDNESSNNIKKWESYESRIHRNMDFIFKSLEKRKIKATFFCLGWIAEKYPDIIRSIDERGYEIGSHTYYHQLIYNQRKKDFDNDLKKSIDIISNLTGKKVKYFRAPGFSIKKENLWALEIIANNGIEIDCSIFPASRSHGGLPSFYKSEPSIISYNDIKLKELPISYYKFLSFPIIFSGGGYFRFFPTSTIKYLLKKNKYNMTYFHPRDFDPNQPILEGLSPFRIFKSYIGLNSAKKKFINIINEFKFVDIKTFVEDVKWKKVNL